MKEKALEHKNEQIEDNRGPFVIADLPFCCAYFYQSLNFIFPLFRHSP